MKVRIFSMLAVLTINAVANAGSSIDKQWSETVEEQRSARSYTTFFETSLSGAAIFAIGTYGANFDSQGFVTSSIYSVLQTGGVILFAQGYRDYAKASPQLMMDRYFETRPSMTRSEMQRIWIRSDRINDYADSKADLMMWGGLTAVYLYSGFREPSSSETLRSLYFFLATNSLLLAGLAGYKLYRWDDEDGVSSSLSFGSGVGNVQLSWRATW